MKSRTAITDGASAPRTRHSNLLASVLATALALLVTPVAFTPEANAQEVAGERSRRGGIPDFDNWAFGRVALGEVSLFYRYAGEGPPVVLVHGWPQHSLMWHTIGPLLARKFTVIALDQRGAGMSTITRDGYDRTTAARDLRGFLDALGIDQVYLAGYDFGAGTAAAFAREYPERVKRLAVMEYGLPGFGYEQFLMPSADWTLNANWHLALFTVPDAAEWLVRGQERELLGWFFYHFAYSGNASVSAAHFEEYAREISKPGALRAGINYYASIWQDAKDNAIIKDRPLPMPTLAIGGEASAGAYGEALWKTVAPNLTTRSIPKAGHWLGDENPQATAAVLLEFFGADDQPPPAATLK